MLIKNRLTELEYFLGIAKVVALRGTCARRQVGCVLVNPQGHIIATGYNGVPKGMAHCIDVHCPGALEKSGVNLDACCAVHAEINALIQCRDTNDIAWVVTTCSPCVQCTKALCNTSASTLIFEEAYPGWEDNLDLWARSGRTYWSPNLDMTTPIH